MNKNYAIIAGTNKAATTSFFEYLAAHPAVCPAFIKQTFFFLDREMQKNLNVVSLYDYQKGAAQYELFFRDCKPGQLKLEASPEYIYARGTPERIFDFLQSHGGGSVLFILREPVSRFISLFYFGKQQGVIDRHCSFHDFMQQSMQHTSHTNTSLMAYDTGFYSKFLENYVNVFGREKIQIYFYEHLMKDPAAFMKVVATDLHIDPEFYTNFAFETHNQTKATVKYQLLSNTYKKARQFMIERSFTSKTGYKAAMLLKKTITPFYRKINLAALEKEVITQEDKALLANSYREEKKKLEQLLNIEVPW